MRTNGDSKRQQEGDDDLSPLDGWGDLTWAFERWKMANGVDDSALSQYLGLPEGALPALAAAPRAVTNGEVEQLCARYGCHFDRLVELLWNAVQPSRQRRPSGAVQPG